MLVHTEGAPENMIPAVRRTIQSLDQTIVTTDVLTLNGAFAPLLYFYRLFGLLVGACGLLAILLAVIGIYGVVAYAVSRRTREIGIRMSMGADKQKILRLVMRQGMILVGCGLSVGLLPPLPARPRPLRQYPLRFAGTWAVASVTAFCFRPRS